MSAVQTYQNGLGELAPEFNLLNVLSGDSTSLTEVRGKKGTLVLFICNHCPFVVHVLDELVKIGEDYKNSGIGIVAISSNDINSHPADGPEQMKKLASDRKFTFPYLYDESQEVAKAYRAMCTPDLMVYDEDLKCIYRGQLDDSRPGNEVPVSGNDLRCVLDALIEGTSCVREQKPSIGCNIKWKDKVFPDYAL